MSQQFFWGSATASHQVEGGTINDWSEWEKKNAERLAREAKTKWEPWQQEKFPEMFLPENYISGKACDHYHRYEEDFDLAREGGHNAHRFSIEWARVEPEEGKFNEKELEHYAQVARALRARGLEPFVTLWHWTLPLWLSEKGGLLAKDFPVYFSRYAGKVAEVLKDEVIFFMTVNEPNSVIANGYITGLWPPQKKNIFSALRAYAQLARAHRETYQKMKASYPNMQIGFTEFFTYFEPRKRRSVLDRWAVSLAWRMGNERFVSRVAGAYDFVGVQNYVRVRVGIFGKRDREEDAKPDRSDMGLDVRYHDLGNLLKQCARYGVPLYVTEDGISDRDDQMRGMFIASRIESMREAMRDSVDVRGYFAWSLLDNFEWDKGFWPCFGLIAVDRKTLERKPRKSFWEYKKIIESFSCKP